MKRTAFSLALALVCCSCSTPNTEKPKLTTGVSIVTFRNFDGCYKIRNRSTEVVLVPQSGGRVLSYALNGENVLFTDPAADGAIVKSGKRVHLDGGRFDIGPEKNDVKPIPPRPLLWSGEWTAEVVGPRSVRLTSQKCPTTGVQIQRTFTLDEKTSHLLVRRTMTNISDQPTDWCFWSRTLARGGGIGWVPLNPKSKFPKGYARYVWKEKRIETAKPGEPRLKTLGGLLMLQAVGKESLKVGLDSDAGWMAYATGQMLFVKRFRYFPKGEYTDALGFSVAVYLNNRMCELEPISPKAVLKPGESYTFDEEWWLFDYPAAAEHPFDYAGVKKFVAERTALTRPASPTHP